MAQRLVPLYVDNEHIKGSGVNLGAAGSHDAVVLELRFSELWRELTKRVLWIDALGENSTETILTAQNAVDTDTYHVTVPATPLAHPGKMSMTITGVYIETINGEQVETVKAVTEAAYFRVMESYADALTQSDIDPSLADQLQAEIDALLADITDARAAAKDAEAWAVGQIEGADVPDTDPRYENNAKHYATRSAASATESENSALASEASALLASGEADDAADSATAAAGKATLAESWAIGGTGTRSGEDTDNAKYWSDRAQQAASGAVASFNGRTGVVDPMAGDYTPDMVGAVAEDAGSTVTFALGCDEGGVYMVTQ